MTKQEKQSRENFPSFSRTCGYSQPFKPKEVVEYMDSGITISRTEHPAWCSKHETICNWDTCDNWRQV